MEPRSDDPRVERLLEELLSSERSPAEVCRDTPELLAEVTERWRALCAVRAQVSELFPSAGGAEVPAPGGDSMPVPQVPGHEIEGVLGRGGMGIVYRARQLSLNRVVALKVLLLGVHASARELARFRREAEVVAALKHPHIVQVFDTGEAGGWPFFTMEFMNGGSLAERIGGKLQAAREAATLVATLADAVESAHRCGVIHRDLKPANILLTAEGTPKISDFGLARRDDQSQLTQSGTRLGTPTYMPPEQALGRLDEIGPPTDIYALGVILYELIAGRPPFEAPTPGELHRRVVHELPTAPSRRNAKVPRDLETICLRCLQKDPARRYPTAVELAADLQRFLRHEPVLARPVGWAERSWHWCRRKPALAGLVLTGVTLAALTIVILLRELGLAAERRAEIAKLLQQLDGVVRLEGEARLGAARAGLAGLSDGGSEELRRGIARARADLELAEELEQVRLRRAVLGEGRFVTDRNKAVAEERYRSAFAGAQLGAYGDAPADVAARVAASGVRTSLVQALDDWAMCTADEPRRAWLLEVAQRADPAPTEWLRRLRDPSTWNDGPALAELAASAEDSQPVMLLVALGERLHSAHRDGAAFLAQVLRRHPGDFWANFALADALWGKDTAEAIRYYQAAVALRPDIAVSHANLARSLALVERNEEAIEHFRMAIAIDAASAIAHGYLGNLLLRMERRDEAIAEYETALRLDPGYVEAHSNLGVALLQAGRFEEAAGHYQEALRIQPQCAKTRANLGNALAGLGRSDEAMAQYRLAVQYDPDDAIAQYGLGLGLALLGRCEEAIVPLRQAIRLQPKNQLAHVQLAECLMTRGQLREAVTIWQQCLALKVEDDRPGLVLRRMVLLQEGRGEEARSAWQAWLAKMPPTYCLWEGYAELCAFTGQLEEHRRACEVMAGLADDDVRALARVGFASGLVPGSEEQVQRATEQVERAVTADASQCEAWERPWFLLAKALLAYRGGRFDDALALLSRERLESTGVAKHLVAAMACHRLGRTDEARAMFAAAMASMDWRAARAIHRDAWIEQVLRREAEALLVPDLAALLAGQRAPRDQHERLALLGACQFEGRNVMTARLYADASAADPTFLADGDQRQRAARAAAFAGAGRGVDAAVLSAKDMADWRAQARAWLREGLANWRDAVDRGQAGSREAAARAMGAWQGEASFVALREPLAADYPKAERDECRSLWSEVEALLARTAAR